MTSTHAAKLTPAILTIAVLAILTVAAIMAFAAVMTVSAQSDDPDWKLAPTGLNVSAGDQAGELNIAWHAHLQTSKTLSDYRVTWTPDGESFKTNNQTEWYAYPTTNQVSVTGLDAGETYKVRVRARYDDNKKSRWSNVMTGQAGVTTNTPTTGQPTIAGTAEVGETLTAATSAIADANGLTNAVFSHQWIRSTNGSDNDITDATSSTYVVTTADAESKLKVRVSFTDDDGYAETLTSASTASVPAQSQNQPRQAATDATLSALVLQDASDDSTVLSNPSFLTTTTDYTASVTRDVVEITIIPTLNDSNASYEIQDGTGTALTDADTNQDEFQVTIPLGETTVKIEVTAEDGNTTETYAVVVTRAHVELLSATLRVSVHASGNTGYQDGFFGSLSDRTFSFAGTSYTISHLYYGATPTRLILTADNSFTDTAKRLLVLKLDSTTFKFNDAVGSTNRQWTGPGLTWANAQRVRVIISGPELPNATTGLTATADSIDRINLRWHAPNDDGDSAIGGYRIEVSDDGGTTWTNHVSNTESGDTTYTHRFISPGTTNHYRVSAINGLGAGPASNVANATTDPGRQVWSATVTAGLISSSTTGTVTTETFGYSADDSVGSITDATFMIRGTEYTVELVSSYGLAVSGTPSTRWIYLDLDKALPTDITIAWYLARRDYRLADAATINETDHSYRFVGDKSDAALDWSTGDTISMTLTVSIADATLSALAIEGTTNGESITLSPSFRNDTFTYTAAVPNEIDAVTLTATTNDSNATVAITDDSDTNTPDTADLDLDFGTNTLTVTVTAEDGSTQTYTINITRTDALQAPATVPPNWSLSPFTEENGRGQQFQLIFLSATKRDAQSTDIEDYNSFIQARAAAGHTDIQTYSAGFRVVGCTEDVDARDNTDTTGTGVPIYWLNGNKVADNYQDFYNGSWDDEANPQNESGNNGLDTSLSGNRPWTGCDHNGTEQFSSGQSQALGTPSVRTGHPNSGDTNHGPLSSISSTLNHGQQPMYGLSQVFTVVPGNTGTLTTGGTPRSDTLDSSDSGHYWQVRLHQNVRYRIDVKGSESSQYGGTITNPRVQVIAGSPDIELLNRNSAGVYQTMTTTVATGGGAGHNSRLDIKVTGETKYYFLLIHRGAGDDGSYTVTVNRLDWPQGRLAPEITVNVERFPVIAIQWDQPAKTHHDIRAPIDGYKVQHHALPSGAWSAEITKSLSQRLYEFTDHITQGQPYEVRVRSYHNDEHPNNAYRWGYATVYINDCEDERSNTCSIGVNQTKRGRINYESSAIGDLDGYYVDLVSGRTYVIRVNGKSTGNGTLVDPYLELFREENTVASDDNGGQGLNSKITYTPTSTGDFLIQVSSSVADERGTYTVKVTEQ